MSTLAEIEAVVASLTEAELIELEQFIRRTREGKARGGALPRQLPPVPATGQAIGQDEIDDALDADWGGSPLDVNV
jgi:hypothetical protein